MDIMIASGSRARIGSVAAAVWLIGAAGPAAGTLQPMPARAAGRATARIEGPSATLGNRAIAATFDTAGGHLHIGSIRDVAAGTPLARFGEAFAIALGDGRTIRASELTIVGKPRVETLTPQPGASRLAERAAGRHIVASLRAADAGLDVAWRAILRDDSRYIRQEVTIGPLAADLPIAKLTLVDAVADQAAVSGTVAGSPIVTPAAFFGFEHPMSACTVDGTSASCSLTIDLPLKAGQRLAVSSVVGIAPAAQRRRAMLAYLERERAHPYRTFLHYNSWYDIGFGAPYDEAAALDVVGAYGRELVAKRGVKLDSFLFDDGWDDPKTLWAFHSGFPRGFAAVGEATRRAGAAPGVWLSPWGGYAKAREQRLALGKAQGFETNERGFALSGPVYYKRFREVCLGMLRDFGVNQFKFDGIGRATGTVPGSEFGSDFEAAIHLIGELRAASPDVYINLTTGTWPSPFWLRYADSIWRGGSDHSFAGVGSWRQKWITYRDAQTYKNIVQGGPLFPLNSLMLHGLIYARQAQNLGADPEHDFSSEIRSYFGTGTQLQEMYVTPSLLNEHDWDTLAETAKWSRANATVLADTHWIGGDPAALEAYGWAAWSPAKAIFVLRNPADHAATFTVDIAKAFELPAGAATRYTARSPWREDAARPAMTLVAGTSTTIELKPFEVMTLEAVAAR